MPTAIRIRTGQTATYGPTVWIDIDEQLSVCLPRGAAATLLLRLQRALEPPTCTCPEPPALCGTCLRWSCPVLLCRAHDPCEHMRAPEAAQAG